MKNKLMTGVLLITALVAACSKQPVEPDTNTNNKKGKAPEQRISGPGYSQLISKDSANRMIQSYLNSINYPSNDSTLRYLMFDADSLRNFLNDTSHGKIATVKFMLAHKLNYINQGKYGVDAHMVGTAITLVMVGMSENEQYIFSGPNNAQVYDNFYRCPNFCDELSAILP